MKNLVLVCAAALISATIALTGQQLAPAAPGTKTPPVWAFPVNPPRAGGPGAAGAPAAGRGAPAPAPAPVDATPRSVPNSSITYTLAQIRDSFNVPDWHPDNHPPAPDVVIKGRRPDLRACGFCHLPNGQGRPENAPLVGQSAAYIVQQMNDFRNGTRKNPFMEPIAKAATDEEIRIAAEYFAAGTYRPWIKVTETMDVPKTRVQGNMWVPVEPEEKEPLGQRIIETGDHNVERVEVRDSDATFIAYAPVGSVKRGEAIVTTGGRGKSIACATCHGADLRGVGPVPGLAGRSPSYIGRQLWNFREDRRNGLWSDLMNGAAGKLTDDDIVDIAAYLASRPVAAAAASR